MVIGVQKVYYAVAIIPSTRYTVGDSDFSDTDSRESTGAVFSLGVGPLGG